VEFSNQEYFGFAKYARSQGGEWRLYFNWWRIGVIIVLLGILAYAALTTFLYCWFRYKQEWEETKISEMIVFPFSLETRLRLRKNIGDKVIADAGIKLQEDSDFGKYFLSLRRGLVYSPNNPAGRMDFSSLFFFQKRTHEALELLSGGLPYALNHKDYVQFFVKKCIETAQDDALILAANSLLPLFPAAEKAFPQQNELEGNRMFLIVGAAQANLLRGRFAESRALLEKYDILNTVSGRILLAQIDWETGARERALENLEDLYRQAPHLEEAALLYALYLKESEKTYEARDVLVGLALQRNDPAIRIHVLSMFDGDRNRPYRNRLIKEFREHYKDNSDALLLLAQYATDAKNFELIKELYDDARERTLSNLPKFELLYIESLIVTGQSDAAIKMIEELDKGNFAWVSNYQGVIDCLRALGYYSAGQISLGKIYLDRITKNQNLSATRLLGLARRLYALGFEAEAQHVYECAYLLDNRNQHVLIELVTYALDHEDVPMLVRYLPPLLETRRPPRALLKRVQEFLGSDRLLFVVTREELVNSVTKMLDESVENRTPNLDSTVVTPWF